MRYEETRYGFNYGAADVERVASDEKKGWVALRIKTPRKSLQIYVTKTGKVRVSDERTGKEWREER
jgi:hypothetical protein